ncbi:hypothetical protein ACIP79_00660 [Streptomyces sp. NPDC088747]|uniref:hypothetical protein n=1 Tax=Streptomyces sp. NPDC088747 TaxID=3365886 RepID=UPI003801A692
MNKPECTSIDGVDHKGHAIETCYKCGTDWPCKTWRRWTKSKDYRIAELEAAVKRLADQTTRDGEKLRELERAVRDDSNILRNGVFRAMTDLGKSGRMGNLDLSWAQDIQDFTMMGTSHITRVAGRSELTVTYEDVSGYTWTNGVVTERTRG